MNTTNEGGSASPSPSSEAARSPAPLLGGGGDDIADVEWIESRRARAPVFERDVEPADPPRVYAARARALSPSQRVRDARLPAPGDRVPIVGVPQLFGWDEKWAWALRDRGLEYRGSEYKGIPCVGFEYRGVHSVLTVEEARNLNNALAEHAGTNDVRHVMVTLFAMTARLPAIDACVAIVMNCYQRGRNADTLRWNVDGYVLCHSCLTRAEGEPPEPVRCDKCHRARACCTRGGGPRGGDADVVHSSHCRAIRRK